MPFIAGRFVRRLSSSNTSFSSPLVWACRQSIGRYENFATTTNNWRLGHRPRHLNHSLPRYACIGTKLHRSLSSSSLSPSSLSSSSLSSSSSSSPSTVSIGGIHRKIRNLDSALAESHLIPHGYLPYDQNLSQRMLQHLQWMMIKDNLDQDMLLVGPPGAGSMYRRSLALLYAELTRQEVEVVTLSSDTTESDLKQRRELVHSSFATTPHVVFVDQAPVRAAIHGRILILDGVEKAERNVLPTLNNLLENREMNLEDGRFLVSPDRYNQLTDSSWSDVNEATGTSSFLVPTHRDFRVIALGVPCPPFSGGRSLDPPLRSRFQIRRIDPPDTEETYETLVTSVKLRISPDVAKLCATVDGIMNAETTTGKRSNTGTAATKLSLPACFPSNALPSAASIVTAFPGEDKDVVLRRLYPFGIDDRSGGGESDSVHLSSGTRQAESARLFEHVSQETITDASIEKTRLASSYEVVSVTRDVGDPGKANISFALSERNGNNDVTISVPCGRNELNQSSSASFVRTKSANATLAAMMQEHYGGRDVLLLGPKGEGKSAMAFEFASMLGYDVELFGLHKDMSSLDLLMRRSSASETSSSASSSFSSWVDSPLVRAAREGKICILDGVEKISHDCLASLHSLVTQREISLPDGSRLVASQLDETGALDQEKATAGNTVHPNFRILALASAPSDMSDQLQWVTDDVLAMFSTLVVRQPRVEEVRQTLMSRFPSCPKDELEKILTFHRLLTTSVADDCGVAPLSLRNLIRIVKQVDPSSTRGTSCLHQGFSSLFLADLLPSTQRTGLMSLLKMSGITKIDNGGNDESDQRLEVVVQPEVATIGNVEIVRKVASRPEMVPSPLFIDIPSHVKAIQQLLTEWNHGERSFLLLGNQGCGKNKIVDRLCQLAGFEREYMQLHRDSTVGQLTLSPYLENGKLRWKDSPLVRAIIEGSSIVVDEADKAPLEVTSILKNLVEDGELLLPDGRRISRRPSSGGSTINIHKDFTLWVLGNRPGYPFHGNDFFREIGDCFSTHVIPNPDVASEIHLLQSYAPSVPTQVIRKIAGAFAELRRLSDIGDISYPYSTREAVSVARHLERYPQDGVEKSLKDIVDFDSFDEDLFAVLMEAFRKNDIDITSFQAGGMPSSDKESPLSIAYGETGKTEAESLNPASWNSPKFGKWDEKNEAHVGGNQWAGGTGGSDTAGLGGRGGPFRLDRGHKVHQVSDAAKAEVSKEAAEAARKIAEAALQERLAEIALSDTAWRQYEEFLEPIRKDIASLRAILRSVKMRTSERVWLKHQSYGEIDDAKLVDGAAGERYIFKRRGFNDPNDGRITHERRRLRFVMDCSASMYRWNGLDGRLQRALEASALVMESFAGTEDKFEYSITGHSGDSSCIKLSDSPPANAKERMRVLSTMVAHTQYCQSGDNTLTAMKRAMLELEQHNNGSTDSDHSIVILVSDANLERYGIHPTELGSVVTGESNGVKGYCIFIASFGSEADDIRRALPPGRGFLCMDTSDLPRIVRSILVSELE